jgi:hypothetical protein
LRLMPTVNIRNGVPIRRIRRSDFIFNLVWDMGLTEPSNEEYWQI